MKNLIVLLCLLTITLQSSYSFKHHMHHTLRHKKEDPPAADPPAADPPKDAAKDDKKDGDKKDGDKKDGDKDEDAPIILEDEMLKPNDFNVTQCNQVVTAPGTFIESLYNTSARQPMVFVMNVYTVSIFAKETPDSLVDSIDMAFVSDIQMIEGAPECVVIKSKIETKEEIPCFSELGFKFEFIKAYEIFKKCM